MKWKNWVVENIFLSTQYRLDSDNQRSKGGFIKSAQQAQRDEVSLGLLERHESEEKRWTFDKKILETTNRTRPLIVWQEIYTNGVRLEQLP